MRAVCWEGTGKIHRSGLEDAPLMYRTFRDKHDACIKVVMTPGGATPHHTNPPPSRQE